MSLRQGVTAQEESKLKDLVSKGTSWDDVVAQCQPRDAQGREQKPLLDGCALPYVKKNIWEPLVARLAAAKKAGHKDIAALDAAEAKVRTEAAAKKKALADGR